MTTNGHMMIASGGPPLIGKQAVVGAMRIYRKIDGERFTVRDSFNSLEPRRPD